MTQFSSGDGCEAGLLVSQLSTSLHPAHSLVLELRLHQAGRAGPGAEQVQECRQLLAVMDIVYPGLR